MTEPNEQAMTDAAARPDPVGEPVDPEPLAYPETPDDPQHPEPPPPSD